MNKTAAPLKILIANIALIRRTGTQMFVRDLCRGLQKAGHQPMVYSPELGEIAHDMMVSGTVVVDDLSKLPFEPDIIHSNQHSEGLEAFLRFPNTWHVCVCHGATSRFNVPILTPYMGHFVAVDNYCFQRLHQTYKIPVHRIKTIYNGVDTTRFLPREILPSTPQRAVVFSNYAGEYPYLEAIKAACQALNIQLDIIGEGIGNPVTQPEKVLGNYDLVFAKARAALEAMAVGCAVILCDFAGMGEMVTSENVTELRRWNFGRKVLHSSHDPNLIMREIRRYNVQDAYEVSQYIRANATSEAAVGEYIQLYRDLLTQPRPQASGAEQFRQYVDIMLKYVTEYEAYSEYSPLADDAALHRLTTERDQLQKRLDRIENSFLYRYLVRPVQHFSALRTSPDRSQHKDPDQ
jgi:glycosyltransferase involved in cell wall biosynthesis